MQHRQRRIAASSRKILGLAGLAVGAIVVACSEGTAPQTPTRAALSAALRSAIENATSESSTLPGSFVAQGLLREKPLAAPVKVTQVIRSRDGGSVQISDADFELRVPKGAFSGDSMVFTVTALAGSVVAYDFQPHGTVFKLPLAFIQHLSHTNLHNVTLAPGFVSQIEGAYFPDAKLIDPLTGVSVVTETMQATMNANLTDDKLTFPVRHFSGYLISTGRDSTGGE